jgi:hypothetical protein
MDLLTLIQFIKMIPGVGPYLAQLVSALISLVVLGALLSLKVKAPQASASRTYKIFYEILQWCALNKLEATNLTAPANSGRIAGPLALAAPQTALNARSPG